MTFDFVTNETSIVDTVIGRFIFKQKVPLIIWEPVKTEFIALSSAIFIQH